MTGVDALCPECETRIQMRPGEPIPECPGCRRPFPALRPAADPRSPLEACSVCGGPAFYLQKDFNQRIGCLIFLAGAALAPWTHYLSLVAGSLLDGILYLTLPNAGVCYTCRSVFRGYPRHPEHGAYDPNVAWTHRPRSGPWAVPPDPQAPITAADPSSGTDIGRGSPR
jgi:hypothetical protein